MVNRALTSATSAFVFLTTAAVAAPIVMTGKDALTLASRLAEDGQYADAETILRELSAGDPQSIDMRAVDRLAAKIAFAKGDEARAIDVLSGVAAASPDDWRVHYDLAHVAITAKRDRLARRQLISILNMGVDPVVQRRVRDDLRLLSERQVVRLSFAATAAPSTNLNSATRDETFDFAGAIPFELSDDARAQSGIGLNWSLGGTVSPPIRGQLRGHFAANSTITDYSHSGFDGTASRLEAGLRHRLRLRGIRTDVTAAATYARRTFAGDDYSAGVGGRLAVRSTLSPRTALTVSFSATDMDYISRHDRDGWMTEGSISAQHAVSPTTRIIGGVTLVREDAVAASETNNRVGVFAGTYFSGPFGMNLGIRPSLYVRSYDAASFTYGTVRKDTTAEVALSAGHPRIAVGGIRPSFVYRYTVNNSSVTLFDYDRHGADISFARSF